MLIGDEVRRRDEALAVGKNAAAYWPLRFANKDKRHRNLGRRRPKLASPLLAADCITRAKFARGASRSG
jgi:hypothetical protein